MKESKAIMRRLAYGLVCIVLSGTASAANPHSDDWDINGDLSGWKPNTAHTSITVVDVGGNPNGYLYTESTGFFGGGDYYSGATSQEIEYTGNYNFTKKVRVTVDLIVFSNTQDFNGVYLRMRYNDSSHNGWRYLLTSNPTYDAWHSYSVVFEPGWTDSEATAAGWIQETITPRAMASFVDTMSFTYSTEIRFEANNNVMSGIDNFKLTTAVTVEAINDYIQNLSDNCFKNNTKNRMNTFDNKLDAVQLMIDNEDYQDAINKLENDIKDKVGKWITCLSSQDELLDMLDDLIDLGVSEP